MNNRSKVDIENKKHCTKTEENDRRKSRISWLIKPRISGGRHGDSKMVRF